MQLFDGPGDYVAFLKLLAEAQGRTPVRCLAYCLMPNHFHLVLWPRQDGDLSRLMFWLTTVHAKRWHAFRNARGLGHVYQGRFKAHPVCEDIHFLRVCRYVERNAVRAGLVSRAEDWQWSSLFQRRVDTGLVLLEPWPVPRPPDWLEQVNKDDSSEVEGIRQSVRRGSPYGPKDWTDWITESLDLRKSVVPLGRPRGPEIPEPEKEARQSGKRSPA